MKRALIFMIPLLFSAFFFGQEINITSDFPGGNIIVDKITSDTIYLRPDLKFTEGKWFHWSFKVSNTNNKKITFQLNRRNLTTKYGPAYSINNDNNWKWYGENSVSKNSFTYHFKPNDSIAYFSVSIPYTQKNLNLFLSKLHSKELIQIDTLCFSKENRPVERIRIKPNSDSNSKRVLITARHHACETSASYVLEGIVESILNEKKLTYLREHVEFLFIPFMDKDGVENGEQGKNRIPRDHNRDYIEEPIHNSTKTLRNEIPDWSKGKLAVAIDIHSPGIKGKGNNVIYLVGEKEPEILKNQIQFSKLIQLHTKGDFDYDHKNFIPYGVSWNSDKNYIKGRSFAKWASNLNGVKLATTVEVPYANISGVTFSKDGARTFGKTIAYALDAYLKTTN